MTDDEIWGPFQWYDMFTRMGWLNWYLNALTLDFAFWWEIKLAVEREELNDWSYETIESNLNFIDMNRLLPSDEDDPYDEEVWSQKEDGRDCNGNVGQGLYCYCPSMGYVCTCQRNSFYAPGQIIKECFDHYGFDCSGNWVDGEDNWCKDRTNPWW